MASGEQDLTIFFKKARQKPVAIVLDCCLLLSIIFNEPERKMAEEIIDIVSENKKGIYLGIRLQTVDAEIREAVTHNMQTVFSKVMGIVSQIDEKAKEGTRIYDVVRKEQQALVANSHHQSYYSYLERSGYGLLHLAESEERRINFVQEIIEIPDRIFRVCNDLLNRFQPVHNKDDVARFRKDKKKLRKLVKATPNLGSNDRGHLISCHLYACSNERNTLFVTSDEPLLKLKDKIITALDNQRLRIIHPNELLEYEEK